ncbi:MAG TPA: high-potential iron-sulfur protein [Candidatus Binatia bacterium]|nr:high-potential iron-sulfur protein [Candidatus Binatia bacterium]
MRETDRAMTRRAFVKGAVVLPALAAALLAQTEPAQAKGSKAQFKYQDSPSNGHKCSQCTFYIAGSSAKTNGTCKIVDGSISPNGWCTAFAAKSS